MPDDGLPPGTYDEDFFAWSQSQADARRALAAGVAGGERPQEPRLLALDWDNLAEQIESLGKADRRELGSRFGIISEHLLNLEFSHHHQPRHGWISTILRDPFPRDPISKERYEIDMLLRDSPSLGRLAAGLLQDRFNVAAEQALSALEAHGEQIDASAHLAHP